MEYISFNFTHLYFCMAFVLHFKLWQQKSQNQEKIKTQKIENDITASSKDFREKNTPIPCDLRLKNTLNNQLRFVRRLN